MISGKVAQFLAVAISLALMQVFVPTMSPASGDESPMLIGYPQGARPFFWENEGGPHGILMDFMNEILSVRLGIPVRHEGCPWARCQEQVRAGEKDALLTVPTPQRHEYAFISRIPLYTATFRAYTAEDNPHIEIIRNARTLDDILSHSDLIHIHIRGSGWHAANLRGVKHQILTDNIDEIWQKLRLHRADVYIQQDLLDKNDELHERLTPKIIKMPTPLASTDWHICIGKKSPFAGRMKDVDSLLDAMKKDGSLDRLREEIFSRYR